MHAHRIASSLQHTTQYAFLWLNQQAGKTNLKNTNIADIKNKIMGIFSNAGAFLDQEP